MTSPTLTIDSTVLVWVLIALSMQGSMVCPESRLLCTACLSLLRQALLAYGCGVQTSVLHITGAEPVSTGGAGKEPPPVDVPAPEPIPYSDSEAIMADLCGTPSPRPCGLCGLCMACSQIVCVQQLSACPEPTRTHAFALRVCDESEHTLRWVLGYLPVCHTLECATEQRSTS